ncbi:phosphatidate cytidylyltransferase [Aeromicrobium sp. CTD01-1L150]|uniref:phosphatidate cytidylyltransferase n=1 Tax=Aeromicrobium sp. CTD01-1L150 TaxID=3341830 RepID=UPI0035C1A2E9
MKSDAPTDGPPDGTGEAEPAEAQKQSRAGRDLPAAIGVGLVLGLTVLASLFLLKDVFVLVVVLALGVGLWELSRALRTVGIAVPFVPVVTGGTLMLVGAFYGGMETAAVAMALTVIGTLVWRLSDGADGFVRDSSAGIFSLSYLHLMGVFVMLMVVEDDGPLRIVAFIVVTICSDTGGYVAGVLLGRHPMAPSISPKKSWEGFAGSLLFGVTAGIVLMVLLLDAPWWVGVVLGVAAVAMATLGDLSESLIKRDLGIKDMGDLLPGHGGLMDRLDSLIAVAPVAWLILYYLVPLS